MASWRDYARKEHDAEARAISANSANSPALAVNSVPNGTKGTNGTALPSAISSGLKRLHGMALPKGADPLAWNLAAKAVENVAAEGVAAHALNLGWSPLDLFGRQLDRSGDANADGLAVWLQGRRLVALTVDQAVATDANGGRHYFNRPRAAAPALLWELGGGG